jgi:hypothetical protein
VKFLDWNNKNGGWTCTCGGCIVSRVVMAVVLVVVVLWALSEMLPALETPRG